MNPKVMLLVFVIGWYTSQHLKYILIILFSADCITHFALLSHVTWDWRKLNSPKLEDNMLLTMELIPAEKHRRQAIYCVQFVGAQLRICRTPFWGLMIVGNITSLYSTKLLSSLSPLWDDLTTYVMSSCSYTDGNNQYMWAHEWVAQEQHSFPPFHYSSCWQLLKTNNFVLGDQ